ncbi:hypothetical protein EPN81_04180 [Patescibacteria group bacterium]|nr:MAG: hypothetical protein EPN81_04180 [Patescibacteria group bacterium]
MDVNLSNARRKNPRLSVSGAAGGVSGVAGGASPGAGSAGSGSAGGSAGGAFGAGSVEAGSGAGSTSGGHCSRRILRFSPSLEGLGPMIPLASISARIAFARFDETFRPFSIDF